MKLNKPTLIGLTVGSIIVLGVVITVAAWPGEDAPPPTAETIKKEPKKVLEYMASQQFASLDQTKKQEYFDKLAKDSDSPWRLMRAGRDLPEEQRKQLRKTVRPLMRQYFRNQMNDYFKLSPEEKKKFLDKWIDKMQEGRKRFEAERKKRGDKPRDPNRPRRRGRHRSPEHMKKMLEGTSPKERAQFMQLMMDMRKRMQERGIRGRGPRHH